MSFVASGQGGSQVSEASHDLVRRLRTGCPEAFATLQAQYLDAVHAYVVRRVGDRDAADDIVGDVFEAEVVAVRRFRGKSGLYAWLLGIANRKVVDWRRREGRRVDHPVAEVPEGVDLADPARFVEQGELHRAVRAAIAELPDSEREALLLQAGEGLSLEEISEVMHRSPNAVKCLHRRARARLRAKLAPLLDEPEGAEQ